MKTLTPLTYLLLKEIQTHAPARMASDEESEAAAQLIREGRSVYKATSVVINGVKNDDDYYTMDLTPAGHEAIKLWEQFGTLLSRQS